MRLLSSLFALNASRTHVSIVCSDDFEKSVAAQEEKMKALQEQVDEAKRDSHYALDTFTDRRSAFFYISFRYIVVDLFQTASLVDSAVLG